MSFGLPAAPRGSPKNGSGVGTPSPVGIFLKKVVLGKRSADFAAGIFTSGSSESTWRSSIASRICSGAVYVFSNSILG